MDGNYRSNFSYNQPPPVYSATTIKQPISPSTNKKFVYVIEPTSSSESADHHKNKNVTDKRRQSPHRRSSSSRKFKNAIRTPPTAQKRPKNEKSAANSSTSTDDSIKITDSSSATKNSLGDSSATHDKKSATKKLKNGKTSFTAEDAVHCLKFLVFGCTLVALLVNFGLLSLGAFLKADLTFSQFLSENYRQTTETQFTAPTIYKGVYIFIGLSALAIVVNMCGCCGLIRLNICMLCLHFGILTLILLCQIGFGLLWHFRREAIENEVGVALDYIVQHYYQGPGIVQEVLDSLQTTFRCCGNAGCGDFIALRLTVPRSCDLDCYGCRDRIFRFLRDGMKAVYIFGIAMICAELISIITVLYLICRLKENPDLNENSNNINATVYRLKETNYSNPSPSGYSNNHNLMVAEKLHVPIRRSGRRSSTGSSSSPTIGDKKNVVYLSYPVHAK